MNHSYSRVMNHSETYLLLLFKEQNNIYIQTYKYKMCHRLNYKDGFLVVSVHFFINLIC